MSVIPFVVALVLGSPNWDANLGLGAALSKKPLGDGIAADLAWEGQVGISWQNVIKLPLRTQARLGTTTYGSFISSGVDALKVGSRNFELGLGLGLDPKLADFAREGRFGLLVTMGPTWRWIHSNIAVQGKSSSAWDAAWLLEGAGGVFLTWQWLRLQLFAAYYIPNARWVRLGVTLGISPPNRY